MSTSDDGPSMEEINEILEALDKAAAGLGEHWPALDAARYLMFPAVKMLVREEGPEQASKTITMPVLRPAPLSKTPAISRFSG
jgi:hypothetical protein